MWSSTATAHSLQFEICSEFGDDIQHTLVVSSGYFSSCCPSIILSQLAHSRLISNISTAILSTRVQLAGYFLFFGPFSVQQRDGCVRKTKQTKKKVYLSLVTTAPPKGSNSNFFSILFSLLFAQFNLKQVFPIM